MFQPTHFHHLSQPPNLKTKILTSKILKADLKCQISSGLWAVNRDSLFILRVTFIEHSFLIKQNAHKKYFFFCQMSITPSFPLMRFTSILPNTATKSCEKYVSFNLSLFNTYSHSRRSAYNQAVLIYPGKGWKVSKEEPRRFYTAFNISTAEFKLLHYPLLLFPGTAGGPGAPGRLRRGCPGGAAHRQSRAGPQQGPAVRAPPAPGELPTPIAGPGRGWPLGRRRSSTARALGGTGCRHPTPLAAAPGPRELRPAGATHPHSAAMQLPARHLLPARTGPSPALLPTTGRVSLCSCRRHFPAATASVPVAVRSLHSPGPGTASPSLPCPCATVGTTQTERRPRPSRPYQRGPPSARGATPLREFRPAQSARSASQHAMRGSRRLVAAAG